LSAIIKTSGKLVKALFCLSVIVYARRWFLVKKYLNKGTLFIKYIFFLHLYMVYNEFRIILTEETDYEIPPH